MDCFVWCITLLGLKAFVGHAKIQNTSFNCLSCEDFAIVYAFVGFAPAAATEWFSVPIPQVQSQSLSQIVVSQFFR
jgi:hypothetical protein